MAAKIPRNTVPHPQLHPPPNTHTHTHKTKGERRSSLASLPLNQEGNSHPVVPNSLAHNFHWQEMNHTLS